jgi:quercetin dioxygenase-like cupin family protein
VNPAREYGAQRFVRHEAAAATWVPWRVDGFEARDLGIASATKGTAVARVLRASDARSGQTRAHAHDAQLLFAYVLQGQATLRREGGPDERIGEGDAFVIPAGLRYAVEDCAEGLEVLEATLPA